MVTTAASCRRQRQVVTSKTCSTQLERLRQERRAEPDPAARRGISKQIQRLTRASLRRQRTVRTTELLNRFSELQKLDVIHRSPVIRASKRGPDLAKCAELLAEVYKSDAQVIAGFDSDHSEPIDPIRKEEVVKAIKRMPRGKAADRQGVLLEMLLHAGDGVLECLVELYNQVVRDVVVPSTWQEACFTLLHKGGDVDDPNNWRPIALLSITYKVFARVVFNRIRSILDQQQSEEQYGFQRNRSTSDAMLAAECLISKSIEFNTDLWLVSVDLRKAFDRVEQAALFTALQRQGLPVSYIKLLHAVYKGQRGVVGGDRTFPITRGVRQGDVLSPLLFNCVLEDAMREWKKSCEIMVLRSVLICQQSA